MPRVHEDDDFEEDLEDDEYEVGDVVEEVLTHPRVRRVFDLFTGTLDKVGQLIDQVSRVTGPAGPAGSAARPANGSSRPHPKVLNPYLVMGFQPGQKLTEEMIKARKKKLAKVYHPDTEGGGDPEAIRMVNAAADMLLRKLTKKP